MTLNEAKDFARWLSSCFVMGLLIVFCIWLLPIARDDTDGAWPDRSGVKPRTDALTGCQYLETDDGGITPRLDGSGRQVGCRR